MRGKQLDKNLNKHPALVGVVSGVPVCWAGRSGFDGKRLWRILPVFHGNKVKKPVLVVQGTNDPRVLQVKSDEMVAAIRKNGGQ